MSKTTTDNDCYLQVGQSLFEPGDFYAWAALTLFAPTLLFCAGINQLWPFWVMVGNEALGALVGIVMYKLQSDDVPCCVPLTRVRKAQQSADVNELKKAA